MDGGDDRIERLSPRRRGTIDYMRMAGRRSNVHGLVEVDVTDARAAIDAIETETGEPLSFTAFVVYCLARAIEEYPDVNTYRDWRGRVHTFEEVDVNVVIETTIDGEQIGVPHVLRRANERSVRSLHEEIRAAQRSPDPTNLSRTERLALRLPGVLRRSIWRLPQWFPRRWKRLAGTVAVTSVGMFGSGGGWAISPTNYTIQLTVGGIDAKPRLVDGELRNRDMLDLTVTVDHDVVDGAAATRFAGRLRALLEAASGLEAPDDS